MFDDLAKPAPRDETGNRSGDIRNAIPMDDSESKALDQLLAANAKEQEKLRGSLNKSPTMLAKYSNPDDIVATVGADGQLSMKGVGRLTQAKVEQVQGTNDELQTRMSAIQKEVDPDVRQSLLSSFQADFVEQLKKDVIKHKEVADNQSGVPQLRAQLVASEARDKADPLYYKYQSDSTGTERIRNALMQAENHARVIAKDMVDNDPQINRKHALVTTFLDTENKNLAKLLQRKEATDAQIEQETAGLTEENLKVLAAQYPDKTTEELKRIAYGKRRDPDFKVLLDPSATPEDYATAAAAGMKGAIPYVIKEQSARTGTPPEKVRAEIEAMQKLAANDQLLLEAVNKIGTADEKKKFQDMVFAHKLEKGKDAQLDWHKTKLAWVVDLQGKVAANNLKADVKNWNPVNGIALKDIPEIKAIIDRYEVQGKQVGVNELMDRYVTDAPKDQQAERFKLIKDFYGSNLDLNNAGIYGKIDKPSAMKALEARFIGTGFLDTLSGDLARFREKASETKPFAVSKDNTPRSNTDLSAAKVSSWLKEQISEVKTNNSKADDIYGNVTPREARLNGHYKEMGTYLDGMDSAVSDRPRLRAAINAAKPSNNVEDRR